MEILQAYPELVKWIIGALCCLIGSLWGGIVYLAKRALNNNTKALDNNTKVLEGLATRVWIVERDVAVHEARIEALEG